MKYRQKIYFTLGILILFFVIFVLFVIFPLFSAIKKNAQELEDAKSKTVYLATEIKNVDIVEEEYENYKSNLDKIDSLFVNLEIPVDFIRFLQKTAQDSNVSAKISSDSVPKEQPWPVLYFQLSTESTFLNLSRFLEKLENSPYLIEIQNLIINKSDGQDKTKEVDANFLIQVFAK